MFNIPKLRPVTAPKTQDTAAGVAHDDHAARLVQNPAQDPKHSHTHDSGHKKRRAVLAASQRVNTSASLSPELRAADTTYQSEQRTSDNFVQPEGDAISSPASTLDGPDDAIYTPSNHAPASDTSISALSSQRATASPTPLLTTLSPAETQRVRLAADSCIDAMTDTAVQCSLCQRWYKLGPGYRYAHVWDIHKRKCPQKAHMAMLARPAHTPVKVLLHPMDGKVDDPDAAMLRADPRVRDVNAWEVHCDACSLWVPRRTWANHDCGRRRTIGWTYETVLDEETTAAREHSSDAPSATAMKEVLLEILPPSPGLGHLPPDETEAAKDVQRKPSVFCGFTLNTFDDDEPPPDPSDLAAKYARYLDPEPSPRFPFRHSATPAAGYALRPAFFSEDDDDDEAALAPVERALAKLNVDVMLEGTTRRFLLPGRKLACALPQPGPAPPPATVGFSMRQLTEAGVSPFAF